MKPNRIACKLLLGYYMQLIVMHCWFSIASEDMSQYIVFQKMKLFLKIYFALSRIQLTEGQRDERPNGQKDSAMS